MGKKKEKVINCVSKPKYVSHLTMSYTYTDSTPLLSRFYGDCKEFNFMGIDVKLTWVSTQLSLSLALLDFGT